MIQFAVFTNSLGLKRKGRFVKKHYFKILAIVALVSYVIITWPKNNNQINIDNNSENTVAEKVVTNIRKPQLQGDPNFEPKVVKAPASNTKKNEFFRVTSPEAIAYAENDRIAYEGGAGFTPAITNKQIEESKQLQSVIEAVNEPKKYGSRLSPLIKSKKFDRNKFLNDSTFRENYINSAEPGRVYQVNSKSKYKIKRVSPYYQEVDQGDSVTISVQAEPNMPVSITSFDLGKFSNHLAFQTVLADSSGIATFKFFGMPGTFNDSNILASSPTSRGHVKFVVHTKIIKENNN